MLLSNHVQGILSFARGSMLLLATAATAGGLGPWAVLEGGKTPKKAAIARLKAGSSASLDPEAQQSTIPRNTRPNTFHPGNATATYFPFWSFAHVFRPVCAAR